MTRQGKWHRESDAPEGDRSLFFSSLGAVAVRCPLCGSEVELGRIANIMGREDAVDECPECGIEVRVKVEWREAQG